MQISKESNFSNKKTNQLIYLRKLIFMIKMENYFKEQLTRNTKMDQYILAELQMENKNMEKVIQNVPMGIFISEISKTTFYLERVLIFMMRGQIMKEIFKTEENMDQENNLKQTAIFTKVVLCMD